MLLGSFPLELLLVDLSISFTMSDHPAVRAGVAAVRGALIPMITLGIPGVSMTAVLIGALLIYGLRPGPDMFRVHIDFVATVYVALFLAVVVTLVLGLFGNRYFARVL